MGRKSKFILSLIAILFCFVILSQSVLAFSYPKTRTERKIEGLGPKPSWISPVPVVSKVIWELKYPHRLKTGSDYFNYTYGNIATVLAIPAFFATVIILNKRIEGKKRKDLEIKEKPAK